jgi:hypothetical protein
MGFWAQGLRSHRAVSFVTKARRKTSENVSSVPHFLATFISERTSIVRVVCFGTCGSCLRAANCAVSV